MKVDFKGYYDSVFVFLKKNLDFLETMQVRQNTIRKEMRVR